ncbi:MAG: S41 family peptidase [Phycisphaerales bacterium]
MAPDPEQRPITESARRRLPMALLVVLWAALIGTLALDAVRRGRERAWIDPVLAARAMIERDHVDPPPDERMRDALLAATAASTGDPFTTWVPARAEDRFNKDLHGTYVGIGAEVDTLDRHLLIVTPLEDSPALEAGLMAGDLVLAIDGASTLDRDPIECGTMLMGAEGTPVTLRVRHPDGSERDIVVTRRRIVTQSVKGAHREGDRWVFRLPPAGDRGNDPTSAPPGAPSVTSPGAAPSPGDIGYVRITQFTERTLGELTAALGELAAQGPDEAPIDGLVVDLRFNGGGSLGSAIGVADLFIDRGVIVGVRPRRGAVEIVEATADNDVLGGVPMVVLVNGASASASEVVAGALQDHRRAQILGERSFGKGSVQEVRRLPGDAGLLKLTVARYELPSGRSIDRGVHPDDWGIVPDPGLDVPMTTEQYRDMFANRRRFDSIGAHPVDGDRRASWGDPRWIREVVGDEQLARAIELLRGAPVVTEPGTFSAPTPR